MPETHRQIAGRYGAHKSWGNTPDRSARTRPARANSPASIEWHLARLPETFADASHADRLLAAGSARKAWYAELTLRSIEARRHRKKVA